MMNDETIKPTFQTQTYVNRDNSVTCKLPVLEAQGKTHRRESDDFSVVTDTKKEYIPHGVVSDLLNNEGAFKLKKYLSMSDSMTYGQHLHLWRKIDCLSMGNFKRFVDNVKHKLDTTCDATLRKKFDNLFKNFKKVITKQHAMYVSSALLDAHLQFNLIKAEMPPELIKVLTENIPILTQALGVKAQEWTGKIIRLVITLMECASESTTASKVRSLICFFSDFFCQAVADAASTLAHAFSRLLVGEELEAQSNGEGVFESAFLLFSNLFGVKNSAAIMLDLARIRRLESIWKIAKGAKDILYFMYALMKEWIDFYTETLVGTTFSAAFFQKINNDIPAWMTKVASLYNDNGPMAVGRDFAKAREAIDLKKTGDEFLTQLQKLREVPASMMGYFMTSYNQIKELAKTAMSLSYNDQSRFTPFVLYLYGESNIGKSMAQDFLLKDIFIATKRQFDYRRDVYVRNVQQDHWDGYLGQPAIVFDDFCQDLDATTRMAELNELIRMKNTAAYPLKMAHLEDKGNVRFISDFVYISANQELGNELSSLVSHPDAILRRRDVVALVTLKKEYQLPNGHIDKSKLHKDWSFDPRIYEFSIRDPLTNIPLIDGLNYFDFVRFCATEWETLRKHDLRVIDSIPAWNMSDIEMAIMEAPVLEAQMRIPFLSRTPSESSLVSVGSIGSEIVLVDVAAQFQSASEQFIDKLKNFTKEHSILKIAGVVTGIVGLIVGLKRLFIPPVTQYQSEANISGDMKTRFVKKAFKRSSKGGIRKNPLYTESLMAEACSDPHAMDIITYRLRNNTCVLRYKNASICGLAICDTIIMLPAHFMAFQPDVIDINFLTQTIQVNVHECDYRIDDDKDLMFLRLPRKFGQFTSLLNHFHTDAMIGLSSMKHGLLFPTHFRDGELVHNHYQAANVQICGPQTYVARPADGSETLEFQIANGYSYTSCTNKGDCGAPLIALNPAMSKKILGVHVAGHTDFGVATVVTKEYLDEILSDFPGLLIQKEPGEPLLPLEAQHYISKDDKVEIYGRIKTPIYIPCKTEISKTILHSVFGTKTQPAMLKSNGSINPMQKAIREQFVPNITLPDEDVNVVAKDLTNYYSVLLKNSKHYSRIMNENESVNGVVGDMYLKPIDIHTSSGYPLVFQTKGKPGKSAFLLGDVPDRIMSEDLRSRVEDIENDINDGVVPSILFLDTLKDERREEAKVIAGKTRVFNVAPLAFNIVIRKYFLGFSAAVMDAHNEGEIAVGIDPHSDEWGLLYKRLTGHNRSWLAGDFSRYDKQLSFQLLEASLAVIQNFYGDEFGLQRRALWVAMFNAYHVVGDQIYRCRQGNPSGNPLTVIVNSLVNQMIVRCAYLRVMRDANQFRTLRDFNTRISLTVYGDDNLMSVDDRDSEYFTMASVGVALEKYGIVYTGTDKTGKLVEVLRREDITFLKRSFDVRDGVMHAPLPLHIIHEMIAWKRGNVEDREALDAVWESVLIELSHHPREIFSQTQDTILKAAGDVGFRIVPRTYGDVVFKRLNSKSLN